MRRPGRAKDARPLHKGAPFGHMPVSAPKDAVDEVHARAAAEDEDMHTPPPVGGSWERLYTGVVLTLILYVLALWLFTRAYAP